jgi:phage N-6-adenine-methyltransferase
MSTNPQKDLLPIESVLGELVHYEPQKGLKTIAVAEAAELHARRAKDVSRLVTAVRAKLGEQHKFINWWDGQEKQQGARKSRGNGPVTPLADVFGVKSADTKALDAIKVMLSRWRKNLKEPDDLEKEIERVENKCIALCEYDPSAKDHSKSVFTHENEWYTPAEYIKAARDVLGSIDLDPATHKQAQTIVQAQRYFTQEDDGLKQEWHGRVWLNPPYAQPLIGEFVSKMCVERKAGHVTGAIMLTHNYTDTAWFHEAAGVANAICFTRGRVKFYQVDGTVAAPTQGQAFFYFGDAIEIFTSRFNSIGFVVQPCD